MGIRLKNILLIFGITVAVYLGMRYLLPLVIPFFIAYLIVMICHPLVSWLHRKTRINESILITILLTFILVTAGLLLWLFLGKIVEQLQHFFSNYETYQGQLLKLLTGCCRALSGWLGVDAAMVERFVMNNLDQLAGNLTETILPKIMNTSFVYMKGVMGFFWAFVIMLISVVLLNKDYQKIRDVGKENFYIVRIRRVCSGVIDAGGAYFKAQLLIMGLIAVICTIGLFVMKSPYALILGIVIGIMDALPVLGTGTVFVPWAVVKMIQMEFGQAAGFLLLWGITCLAREILEPRLVGKKLGVYPIAILVSIYIGMYLFGVGGLILGPLSLLVIMEIAKEMGLVNSESAES